MLVWFDADSHLQPILNYGYWSLDFRFDITFEGGRVDPFFGILRFLSIQAVNWRFYHEISPNSCFKGKIRRYSPLCLTELLLRKPQIVTRTFARNFDESSLEQKAKFAHFPGVTFAQYCTFHIYLPKVEWILLKTRLKWLFNNIHRAWCE